MVHQTFVLTFIFFQLRNTALLCNISERRISLQWFLSLWRKRKRMTLFCLWLVYSSVCGFTSLWTLNISCQVCAFIFHLLWFVCIGILNETILKGWWCPSPKLADAVNLISEINFCCTSAIKAQTNVTNTYVCDSLWKIIKCLLLCWLSKSYTFKLLFPNTIAKMLML